MRYPECTSRSGAGWGGWRCTLSEDHAGEHEAHVEDDNSDAPLATWEEQR